MKDIHDTRKEQGGGNRFILEVKVVLSTEEVYKALEKAEKAAAMKMAKQEHRGKRRRTIFPGTFFD